jgi:hypothetical protein
MKEPLTPLAAGFTLRTEMSLDLAAAPFGAKVADITPAEGSSRLELSGPRRQLARPYLDASAGPGGLAARVVNGDGQPLSVALVGAGTPKVLPLPVAPIAIRARADGGVWLLTHDSVLHVDEQSAVATMVPYRAVTLVAVQDDAVWAVGLDEAAYISASGSLAGPFPWPGGLHVAGSEDALLAIDPRAPGRLHALRPDGSTEVLAEWPTSDRFERLVSHIDQCTVTISGATLQRHTAEGTSAVTIQSVGLTEHDGEPFGSARAGGNVDVCRADGMRIQLPLPSSAPPVVAIRAVARSDRYTLVYGGDFAAWYDGLRMERSFEVDDETFIREVFPRAWNLAGQRQVTAYVADGVLLSATGPAGAALVALNWC